MQNPFDQFDGPSQAPQMPQPPGFIPGRPKPMTPEEQERLQFARNAEARAAEDQRIQREKLATDQSAAGKTTEGEKLSAGYYSRALRANQGYGSGVPSRGALEQVGINMLPDFLAPVVDANMGDRRRGAESYADEFIRAKLRKESGASIPPDEMAREYRTYFPIPGDGPEDIERKRQLRAQTIEALKVSAGGEAGGVQILPVTDVDGNYWTYDPASGQWVKGAGQRPQGGGPQQGDGERDDLLPGEFYDNGNKMYRDPDTGEVLPVVDVTTNYDPNQQAIIDQYRTNAQDAGGLDAFGEGMVDTITFGLRDELGAAGEAFAGSLRGEGSFGDLYDAHVTGLRGLQGNLQENNGGAYLGGQLIGGFAVPFGSGARGVGGLAKAGAAQGGAYGFGSAEGNALQRLPGAAIGSGAGAAVGAGLGAAGNALMKFLPNGAANQAQREAAPIIQAGERRQVPIRQYDVRPELRQDRGVAMTSERGGPIIRAADEADTEAMEAAVARDLGGDITPGDRFAVGDMTQNALDRTREVGRSKARRSYDIAEKLAGNVKLVPNRAIAEIDNQIAELTAAGPNANKELIGYLNDVKADLSRDGGLTISALRDQRTSLRGQISTRNLSKTDAERRMGMVLDAAAQDIDGGLNGTAQAAFRKADQQWAERSRFLKQVMGNLVGPEDNRLSPEATAARLEGWMKKDANRFRRVWAELDGDERKEIAAAVAGRLGRDSKDNFSISLFLNHTSGKGKQAALSSKSMRLIFGDEGMRAIDDLRAIANAKVAGASEINSSKTGNIVQRVGRGFRTLALSALGFAGAGPVGAIAAPVAQSIASKMGQERMARLLTNPDFTKWLRTAPETTRPEVINRHLARLNKVASRSPVLAADARALQGFLGEAFSTSARKAAAGEDEDDRR